MKSNSWQNMLTFLKDTAQNIRNIETEADDNLNKPEGEEKYRRLQLRKTELLIDLPGMAKKHLESLDSDLQSLINKGLREFADEAESAKKVNSIFYMSVLLYPDEQEESNLNAFDLFIEKLKHEVRE